MASLQSVAVLVDNRWGSACYRPVLEAVVARAGETGAIDVVLLQKVHNLHELDRVLSEYYGMLFHIMERLGKQNVSTRVLLNGVSRGACWGLLVCCGTADLDLFECAYKDAVEVLHLARAHEQEAALARDLQAQHDVAKHDLQAQHDVVAVGGTFDHFHDGHKILLSASAFICAKELIVGITDHELLKDKKYKELLQSFEYRKHQVSHFISTFNPHIKLSVYPINDVCGPTGYIEDIDAIVVSKETVKGAAFVNDYRDKKGMRKLAVHIINVIGEDESGFENKLSSTQLREREYKGLKSGEIINNI